ncbi:MAG TPA: phosphoribosylaminoimidazolesuccinocarboxamide synthase [Desulfobacteraceae bacterium]|nr:phosphoribosylaminoimidazolesuccinocarboxamide synthase [Desulfobacteraceae bacterium]HPJ68855.1 phosphoribosylaminoimidazolesuccinocarboxamide synthase [Desulfobacteraceae bacterium]HPQ29183.1 phosphoribosylaminoimidazolesuccinocarboxamide synthase [Desulfobacteraceae bacterium]
METGVLRTSDLKDLKLVKRGKVRDVYEIEDKLLIVATDRMSAFDVVMDDPIPDKGKILTGISLFWFNKLESIVENHLISSDPDDYPEICKQYAEQLRERSMLVKKAEPLTVECIVRGYLSGSGWLEYKSTGSVCGIQLPEGLQESEKLPKPIFTPSTKAADGMHDENISFDKVIEFIGEKSAEEVRRKSIQIYEYGRNFAAEKGIIVADTKFEFGIKDDQLILIDEVLTPDSSRFWPMTEYNPGGPQKSFDKQFLRDYLLQIKWPKKPPPPKLPAEIIMKTRDKYMEALKRLTGYEL